MFFRNNSQYQQNGFFRPQNFWNQPPNRLPQQNPSFGQINPQLQSAGRGQSPFGAFGFSNPQNMQNAPRFGQQNQQMPPMPQQQLQQGMQPPPQNMMQPQFPPNMQPDFPGNIPQQNNPSAPQQELKSGNDTLKNVGSFMGYPEYKLDGVPEMPDIGGTHPQNSKFGKLKDVCQNERNGGVFYRQLADNSEDSHVKGMLNSIAMRSENRSDRLKDMHNKLNGASFVPEDRKIMSNMGIKEGLALALREETLSMRDCAEIAEYIDDRIYRGKLNDILLEKLCQINELNYLNGL